MTGFYGRPSAAELIEAVREYLSEELLARAPKEESYHLRVAISALGIVAREVERTEVGADYQQRLITLGAQDEATLAKKIRNGEFSEAELGKVKREMLTHVEAKLRVSNPTFVASYETATSFPA